MESMIGEARDVERQDERWRALVVDDDPALLAFLEAALGALRFDIVSAGTLAQAQVCLAATAFDLVLADKNLPDGSGLDLARTVKERRADTAVIIVSGHASVASAVEAIQHGAVDYLIKPVELDDLRVRVGRVMEALGLRRTNERLVEQLRSQNQLLASLAMRDPITTLYNHTHLHDALHREIARCRRHHQSFSLVLFGIDEFKKVNEARGHSVGDEVLRRVADLLVATGRQSDVAFRADELAARFGGDVFALLLPQTSKSGAAVRAESLRARVDAGPLEPGLPRLTLSAGVAVFPDDGDGRDPLVSAASTALQAAQAAGRNRVLSYTAGLAVEGAGAEIARREVAKLGALDEVIANRSFTHVYQPIVDVASWTVFAHEALCRPTAAFNGPYELFATAQSAGRVVALGRATRQGAIGALTALAEPCSLFLNLHPHELDDPEPIERDPTLAPVARRIVLELTEGSSLGDLDRARDRIRSLQAVGYRVALDDLGAGYSSLSYLARLEPNFVKLDMGLVRGIQSDSRSARLIKHLLEFCRGEGMGVVAEGVETADELAVVMSLGVTYVQGYFIARPAPPFPAICPRP